MKSLSLRSIAELWELPADVDVKIRCLQKLNLYVETLDRVMPLVRDSKEHRAEAARLHAEMMQQISAELLPTVRGELDLAFTRFQHQVARDQGGTRG
jgi:hypothetical protein